MVQRDEDKTIKQKRAEARAEKVQAYQKEVAARERRRRIGWISGITGGVAVLALVVTLVATNTPARERPEDIAIANLTEFSNLTSNHITAPVNYEAEFGLNPPAGGDHAAAWLNCGVYSEPQINEHAVHSLEHGAVWVTYDPEQATEAEIDQIRAAIPDQHTIISPFPGQAATFVASAWGAQIELTSADDERLSQFIAKYWNSAAAPEPGASCSGAFEGSGRVA